MGRAERRKMGREGGEGREARKMGREGGEGKGRKGMGRKKAGLGAGSLWGKKL
jgi:hypothetical protein